MEPKLEYRFKLVFDNFGNSNTLPLTQQVIHFKRPTILFNKIEIPSRPPVSIFINDDMGNSVQNLILEQIDKQRSIENYQFTFSCDSLDSNANVLEHWNFKNCSISEVDYGDNDYRLSDPVAIRLVISYNGSDHILY